MAEVQAIQGALVSLRAARKRGLAAMMDLAGGAVLERLDFSSQAEYEAAKETLAELRSVIAEMEAQRLTLRDVVDRLAVGADAVARDGTSLMTLHAAKGSEFPVVFIAGLEEGLLPHRRSIGSRERLEEERRLCFVGMTRAQQRLYLSYARNRLLGGQTMLGGASRFLSEIGASNVTLRVSERSVNRRRLAPVKIGAEVIQENEGPGR
jgi:DNA helicase-2/ATP-dependent DNA helicase PcrA